MELVLGTDREEAIFVTGGQALIMCRSDLASSLPPLASAQYIYIYMVEERNKKSHLFNSH